MFKNDGEEFATIEVIMVRIRIKLVDYFSIKRYLQRTMIFTYYEIIKNKNGEEN